jgi:hypothetical protein
MFGRLYYGWIIGAVAFVSMAFWWGINSSFSVVFIWIAASRKANRNDGF